MKLNEESSDFVYLGKRIDKALDYIQNNKTDLLDWFNQYVEIPYQDIMSGELELEEEDYTFDYLDSLLDDLETKFNIILENQTKMTNEQLRMQMLSGVITESEYKAKLEESTTDCGCDSKESLNENFIGMGMVGNIFDREKTDYEIAFEHFSKGTSLNEDMEEEEPRDPFKTYPGDEEKRNVGILTQLLDYAEKQGAGEDTLGLLRQRLADAKEEYRRAFTKGTPLA